MNTLHSHDPLLNDWVSFLAQKFMAIPQRKDYAWLLDLNSCGHAILFDECSPAYREEIMRDFGHNKKTDPKYFIHGSGC